ncbi:MAG: RNA polymerase sigma factor, partial [Planctomycetota bacterium]
IAVMAEKAEKSLAGPAHNDTNHELLVRKFIQGDDSAFERIVQEHRADVAALANRLLGWPGDVEDVVQNIFLSAFLGLKKFRGQCSLRTWLFTITINECRNYRYRQMLRFRLFVRGRERASHSSAPAADGTATKRETFEQVRRAVKTLPAKYREPVVLKYLQQLASDEIAGMLGISEGTLQVRLSRARKKLKVTLAEFVEE